MTRLFRLRLRLRQPEKFSQASAIDLPRGVKNEKCKNSRRNYRLNSIIKRRGDSLTTTKEMAKESITSAMLKRASVTE